MGSLLVLIGRILFSLIFVGSGIQGHLMATADTAAYAESRGVPNARLLVQVSGVLIALGGVALILGVWADVAALGLAAYSLVAAIMVHHFWTDSDPMQQQGEMTNFMKNLALAGGGLALFAFISMVGEGLDFFITDPLISIDP